MNRKQKQYILNNWKAYDIVDSMEEMLILLNILEAHDETLDSLHDVCCQGADMFCDIYGRFENDRDVASTLFDFSHFFENEDDLYLYAQGIIEDIYADEDKMTVEKYLKTEDIRKTTDGYIMVLWY